jgi:predicted phosphoadenosine phosphosulfate sulfurtransferase
MKIYSNKNVLDAALDRIRYLFDEFPTIVVGFSGGKDSTVTLELALRVAEEKNRLPLTVMWIDQEAEWQGTVDYVEKVMKDPRVKPMWFQMPIVITNNASSYNRYSYCWKANEEKNWIHPKSEISIKENKYGTERFHELFQKIFAVEFKNTKACYLAGVRAEEAPKRLIALTSNVIYKKITYGKSFNSKKEHYTFYPLYDWSYTDIWKYIHDNKVEYNKVYDQFYKHGVNINDMRISNLHHETAIQNLLLVQEIEPKTWNRVVDRIDGASSIKHIKKNSFTCPMELPYMFNNWEEYAMHLATNIIQEEKYYLALLRLLENDKELYGNGLSSNDFWKTVINTILSSDWDFTKYKNWKLSGNTDTLRRVRLNPGGNNQIKHKWLRSMFNATKYLTTEDKTQLIKYFVHEHKS